MIEQRLDRYQVLKAESRQLAETLHELEQDATTLKSIVITGMPTASDGKNHSQDKVIRYMDAVRMYAEKQANIAEELEAIEGLIDSLTPTSRMLLRLRYVDGMTWSRVAVAMNYSEPQVYRLRIEALMEAEGHK